MTWPRGTIAAMEDALIRAVRTGEVIPREVYGWAVTGDTFPSENWRRIGMALDLLNHLHGGPVIFSLSEHYDFWGEGYLLQPRRGAFGSEDFSRIYSMLNVPAVLVAREAFRRIKETRAARAAELLDGLCLSYSGYAAITSAWGPGNDLGTDYDGQRGPLLMVTRHPTAGRVQGLPFCTWAGDRSWNIYSGRWAHLDDGPVMLVNAALIGAWEPLWRSLEREWTYTIYEALRDRGWNYRSAGTPEREAIALAASRNDLGALQTIWREWIKHLPNDRFLIIRRETGVEMVRLYGTNAPTAQLDYCSWTPDGTVRFGGANDGYRQEWIDSTVVDVIDWPPAKFIARETDGSMARLEIDPLAGRIIFAAEFGDGSAKLLEPPGAIEEPEPTGDTIHTSPFLPGPSSEPLGGVYSVGECNPSNSGAYLGYRASNVSRHLHFFKGGGGGTCPWGKEDFHLHDDGWLYQHSEALLDPETGDAYAYRRFGLIGSLESGYRFLPPELPADGTAVEWDVAIWEAWNHWQGEPGAQTKTQRLACSARYAGLVERPGGVYRCVEVTQTWGDRMDTREHYRLLITPDGNPLGEAEWEAFTRKDGQWAHVAGHHLCGVGSFGPSVSTWSALRNNRAALVYAAGGPSVVTTRPDPVAPDPAIAAPAPPPRAKRSIWQRLSDWFKSLF